jgi:general secretion pathway protein F
MPVFAYRARTATGRAEQGLIDADSVRGAWQELRGRGVYPVDLRAAAGALVRAGRVEARELAAGTRQLASLVGAGVPVAEALESAAEESNSEPLRRAFTVARARLREGAGLADALGASPDAFPEAYRELVRAGEASGALGPVLARLAKETESSAARRARVRAALAYPAVMAATTTLVLGFLLVWVVPQLSALFAETGATLPLATRLLLGAATVVRATWWGWAVAAVAGGIAVARWRRTAAGRAVVDRTLLRLPAIGRVVATAAVARAARALATVLAEGVPVDAGLGLAAATAGNVVVADRLRAVRDAVQRGTTLASALRAEDVVPGGVCRLVATAERTGTLAEAFARAAEGAEADVDRALDTATGLVEPALVIVMGAAVLFLVLAILVPILTLNPLGTQP